jgi:hypothetical protein
VTAPWDGQPDVLGEIREVLAHPSVDAEVLGRAVTMLELLVESGLVTGTDAARMLAPARYPEGGS